jgi:glycosyltransferase involved in cell wall biosynthesis
MKHKVSAVLIVMNEAAILENTLKALQWCDEIVVVDSGSTDGTVALCEQYGCRVVYKAFEGFGEQKRFAISLAQHEWILSIDADEVLSEGLQGEIQELLSRNHIEEAGFYLPRTLIFWGAKIRSEYKVPCLRLFHRQKGGVTPDKVHEKIKVSGKTGYLKHPIWHESYRSIHDYFEKFNRYTTLAAQEIFDKKKGKGKGLIVVRLPITFCQLFFLRGCFLNGFAGFMWSLFSAFYPVVKYIKVLELERKAAKEKRN